MDRQSSDKFYFKNAIHVVLYLLENSTSSNIVDILNMIFLADKYHLQQYGRSITRDNYRIDINGFTPVSLNNVLYSSDPAIIKTVNEFVNTKNVFNLVAKQKPNLMVFSESDIGVMNAVISVVRSDGFDLNKHITQLSLWKTYASFLADMTYVVEIPIDEIFDCNDDKYFKVDKEFRELNKSCYHEDEEMFAYLRGIPISK